MAAVMASGAAANRRGKLRRIRKSVPGVVPYNTRFSPIWSVTVAILRMTDLDLAGKRVLIREDLNVPLKDGKVAAAQRLQAVLPTLKHARDAGAKVMVLSHLGRPKEGVFQESESLQPVADWLSHALGKPVRLVRDYLNGVDVAAGEIVLLENCRMNVGEGKDAPELSLKYAALCDV